MATERSVAVLVGSLRKASFSRRAARVTGRVGSDSVGTGLARVLVAIGADRGLGSKCVTSLKYTLIIARFVLPAVIDC